MPKHFDELSDALQQEVMGEMAETFFGERKHVEEVVERIRNLAAEAADAAQEAVRAAAGVHCLLLTEPERIAAFYRLLGVAPEPFVAAVEALGEEVLPAVAAGFALTRGGRYAKLALAAYERLWQTLDAYLYGRPYDDPLQPGRKRLTANVSQIRELTEAVNAQVAKLNECQSPTDVLCFINSMDPQEIERRKVTGATLEGYQACLNRDLAMSPVDWGSLGLPDLPELPRPKDVSSALEEFFADVYARHPDRVAAILDRVKAESR